jgi:hypothetical protein
MRFVVIGVCLALVLGLTTKIVVMLALLIGGATWIVSWGIDDPPDEQVERDWASRSDHQRWLQHYGEQLKRRDG